MKKILYILPVLLYVVAGCGTSRHASRSVGSDGDSAEEIPRIILYPKGYEGSTYSDADRDTDLDVLSGLSFSGLECEHVRVKGVNPLPDTGILEVNLDALAGQFVYPYKGRFLSDYGMRDGRPHTGIDIKTIPDDTIRAVLPGVVRMSKNYSSYGNIVVIRHPQGFETVYAHCSKNLVSANDRVRAGTPIGLAGRTGRATTEHLHFEIRVAGDPVDPKTMLDVANEKLRPGMFYARFHDGAIIAYNHPSQLRELQKEIDAAKAEKEAAAAKTVEENARAAAASDRQSPGAGGKKIPSADYHTVVKGDTLYAISRKYSTSVKELCRLNNIKETDILRLGQKLRVR